MRNIILGTMVILTITCAEALFAQTGDRLREGIDLFEAGRDDAALTIFNEVVEQQPRCPLAYYYAARIRLNKEQYTRAQANLEQAVADSTGFLDAYAYLAITYRELGDDGRALAAWKRFVGGTGALDGVDQSSLASIMLPGTYRLKLAEEDNARQARLEAEREREREQREAAEYERLAKEEETQQAAQAIADSIAAEEARSLLVTDDFEPPGQIEPDTGITVESASESSPEETDVVAGISSTDETEERLSIRDTPLGEIEDRLSADFRTGVIGFVVFMSVLMVGLVGMYIWFRRRRIPQNDEAAFTEQVERLLDDLTFEVDEDRAIRDFESRRREIAEELRAMAPPAASESVTSTQPVGEPFPEKPLDLVHTALEVTETNDSEEGAPPFSATMHPGVFKKPPVTEEVKTLVSRLFREGKSSEEIARVADLTTTEVNLILAVRERRLEKTVAEIHQDEVHHEHDRLFEAIAGLKKEGATPREIARQLDLSLSEVELATSIMTLRGRPVD